jgi:predicted transcriptional regulator
MTKLLERAVETVRALDTEQQDAIAAAMLALAGQDDGREPITADDSAAVLEGLAQARRGERATPQEIEAAFRRFRR